VPSLFLLTGENTYALRGEKLRWMRQFSEKYGDENLTRLEGPKLSFRSLLDEISVAPFLAEKRMIAVEGVPKFSKEEMKMLEGQVHPQNLVLFVDPKPDKRLSGVKELMGIAEVKEFKPVVGAPLRQWIRSTVAEHGASIEPDAMESLIDMIGESQDQLEGELHKLSLHAQGKPITRKDAEEMVSPTDEGVVWKLTDLLSSGRRDNALRFAHKIIERGGDAYGLWAILLNLLKNTVAVHAEASAGTTDQKEISERTGLHFMAVRSLLGSARKLKKQDLLKMVEWAVEADKSLKTGGYRATDEAPEELRALVDRFLLSYPS
jgi:DNA polymerase III delta subunit